ncbi:hypothetical protein ACHAXT_004899 [Thalassiosira profunda]
MSGERSAKRRKADAASDEGGSVVHELREMRAVMETLVDHNSSLIASLNGMQKEMTSMHHKVDAMADKLNQLEARGGTEAPPGEKSDKVEPKEDASLAISLQQISDRQKYHEVLLRNQKWEYPVARPPQDYWDSLEDQRHIDAAERFIDQIENETRKMRLGIAQDGADSYELHQIHFHQPEHEGHITLPYSDQLRPYWEEFARALEEFSHSLKCSPSGDWTSLGIGAVELPDDILKMLSKALHSTHFDRFGFANSALLEDNSLDGKLKFALDYAESNPNLKGLAFLKHNIECQRHIEQICAMIKDHPSIEEIILHGCKADELDGFEMIRSIVASGRDKLKRIDLSDNGLDAEEAAPLGDYLASNPILKSLSLADNSLDDSAAESLARALKPNTNLRYLDMSGNPFSMYGGITLKRAEFDDTSLNSASDSNHSALVIYPGGTSGPNFGSEDARILTGEPVADPKTLRASKVYAVLASRNRENSNVQHFADTPVEVLPDMLQSIQSYSRYWSSDEWKPGKNVHHVEPLSLVCEILRNWDKALSVYESLGNPK